GGMQSSSVGGTVASATGQGADEGVLGRAAGFSLAVNAFTLDAAFQSASKLWRAGRCVMVEAPDYGAATPIEVDKQETSQHDEAVDPDSETQLSVRLKHRFAGAVSAPLKATLSGDKKIDPTQLEAGSGTLKYKAPSEEDKKATAVLRATSKRGIGTLVLGFHTGGALPVSVMGVVRLD